ncbi:MAG: hypothetical protein Q7U84_03265 [Polynucleobacter sp.]|jgi:hypothetical protein|nr:hypothetical protein [Polynucleobacter sp.]
MKAFFATQIQRPARACLAIAFLAISLLGTHWLGYQHSIAHPHSGQTQVLQFGLSELALEHDDCNTDHPVKAMQASHGDHINANCLLFDALTLAGFVSSTGTTIAAVQALATEPIIYSAVFNTGAVLSHYQSRAPPQSLQL